MRAGGNRRLGGRLRSSGNEELAAKGQRLPALAQRCREGAVSARDDSYLPPADARRLLRLSESAHTELALFPGDFHGWDILSAAPYRAAASRDVIAFLRRYS